jgi:hypothetical protein
MNRLAPAVLLTGALLVGGCDKTATFSYFNIHVTLDRTSIDDELLDLINGCAAVAETPARRDTTDLRCVRHRVPNDLGVFQYTTTLTSGSIKFSVVMASYDGTAIAQGQIDPPLGIAPGMTVEGTLVVKAIPGAPRMPPTGTDTDGGTDAAADAAVDAPPDSAAGDGASDGGPDSADGATADGAPDAASGDGATD